MSPSQMLGWSMNQTSTVTNIVSTRIFSGQRPATNIMPCINYFEMAGTKRLNGFERATYSINCRAVTAETALQLARKVVDLFEGGTSGRGGYGSMNGFEVTRINLRQQQGLIPEPDDSGYNVPVDIFIVYPTSSVS